MYAYGYRYNSGLVVSAGGGAPFTNTYSLDFDGVDDYVSAPQSFLNSASTFSMSFWAKKPTAADTLNIGSRIAVYQGMWLNWFSDSNVYFQVRGGANESIIFSLPFDTDWHHFLCTFNNGFANVYVDGILKATQTFTAVVTPPTTGDNFRVGSLDASNFGKSTIDEVALWDSVIPIGDVWDGSGAATDLSLLATPPLHWYRNGDNDTYPTIADVGSLASNPGTMTNMTAGSIVSDVPL